MNFPKLYECDPQKNTECNKRNCGNPCMHTTRKEFAREPSERMSIEEHLKSSTRHTGSVTKASSR